MVRNGKWWETESDDAYIERLEQLVDQQDHNYCINRISVVCEFLRECKEILMFDELAFLCLRLAGYTYFDMEKKIESLSKKDSTMHRKVQRALSKIKNDFPRNKQEDEGDA